MHEVRVNRRAADRVFSGHPWIFSSDVVDRGTAAPGEAVKVTSPNGRALGTAHYSSTSQIALRMLSEHVEAIDRDFFLKRLSAALAFRQQVVSGTEAYRAVHAEADRLPALVVDRYKDWLVIQTLDQGMDRARDRIVDCLCELFSPAGIVARNDAAVRKHEDLPLETKVLLGEPPGSICVGMNGLVFHVSPVEGQKTGIYLDQRENYLAAARYAKGRVLDCFTSTGGFALHMAPHCEAVEAIDSSAEALAAAGRTAQANHVTNIEFKQADVFQFLSTVNRQFDVVVLDPPAFAKSRGSLEGAARGYKEINLRALRLLGPGGVLVSCSCSHHMSEAMLLEIIASAGLDAGRSLRVLERRTQAQDHPILLTVPETHYLKCLILQVV